MSILIMNCRVFKSCFFSKWIRQDISYLDQHFWVGVAELCTRVHNSVRKIQMKCKKQNICCTTIIWNYWNKSLQNKLTHRSVKFVDTFSRKNLVEFYFFQTLCKLSNKMFFDKHHRKLGQVYCLYYINNPAKQRAACSIKFNKIFSWKCINKFDRTVCQFILKRLISIILESELCNIICSNKKKFKTLLYCTVHIYRKCSF